jgi:DNA (cytosine-5)-methyltransferase 1
LKRRFPNSIIHDDIQTLEPPEVELVAGGWPCQDLSIAGAQRGLSGTRSGLLSELLRVAVAAKSKTLVAENVGNLLRLRDGQEFRDALSQIHTAGFPFISWRLLNARDFGLPQHRTRLLLVASVDLDAANSLFRATPELPSECLLERKKSEASGFYWTAGTHSINYSRGYVPTVKIGSSLNIPSPPAVHYGGVARLLTPLEALRLQGFTDAFDGVPKSDLFRMAGNAVPKPIGEWVFEGVVDRLSPGHVSKPLGEQLSLFPESVKFSSSGLSTKGSIESVLIQRCQDRAVNLIDYIDVSSPERLSARAATGLLNRLKKSGQSCPDDLRQVLEGLALRGAA